MALGAILGVAGGALSGFGGYRSKRMYDKLASLNSTLANYQARDSLIRGRQDVTLLNRQAGEYIASQRVAIVANGFELGEGTAAELEADTAYRKTEAAMRILTNARLEAWGLRQQAKIGEFEAEQRGEAAVLQGIGSLIGNIGAAI